MLINSSIINSSEGDSAEKNVNMSEVASFERGDSFAKEEEKDDFLKQFSRRERKVEFVLRRNAIILNM